MSKQQFRTECSGKTKYFEILELAFSHMQKLENLGYKGTIWVVNQDLFYSTQICLYRSN